ncbi:hypothetical protein [Streptomyces albogriseolus]|uniref:hypothetical protein n=1 Tax=Streptomyces albogriseolus TaxID=1887 RepID=UPI003D759B5F
MPSVDADVGGRAALAGGAERTQQADAVLDGSVDQFEHLRDEFPQPGRGEVGACLPVFVDDELAASAIDFVALGQPIGTPRGRR